MHMRTILTSFLVAAMLAGATGSAFAAAARPTAPHPSAVPAPQERRSVTHHHLTIGGRTIAYTATAGTLILKDKKGQPAVSEFYVAYTEDGADSSHRPVTFLYNGGPGAATVFLHMGAFGPRRIVFGDVKPSGGAPYSLVDNQQSLLDQSDLVFIDAPGTGYSRLLPKTDPKEFFGVDQDRDAFGQFIHRYVTLNNRWNSPKFLLGESYGTPRSAVLVDYMQNHYNMSFNGVTLLSCAIDFDTLIPGPGNDLAYETLLPTEAAVAWYHDKSAQKPALSSVVNDARAYAFGPYAEALMQGTRLPQEQRAQVAARVAQLTHLSQNYVELANLRVDPSRFEKELMRQSGENVGRLDARYTGYDLDVLGDSQDYDPSDSQTSGAFQGAFESYARNELQWVSDEEYRQINGEANRTWDWRRDETFPWLAPTTSPDIREAMTTNPRLRVFVGAGYFDLATPFAGAEWTFSHLGLPNELQSHITFGYYDSGHMVYLHEPALVKFHSDLVRFYQEAAK